MNYFLQIGILASIYSTLAIGLNLVMGRTKLLSLAQAAFYGIGAYAVAILTTYFHFNFFVALLVGIICSMAVAFVLGMILSKLKEDYYLLGTLGFTIIFYNVARNWESLTNGAYGIRSIPKPMIFGTGIVTVPYYFLFSIIICSLVYLLAYLIEKSSFGRVLNAIRDDEEALKIFGYKTHSFKIIVFMIGAAFAAVGGSLFAGYITYIDPTSFTVLESIVVWVMIILGGLGSLEGAVLGACIITILPEALRFVGFPTEIAAHMRELLYGLVIVLMMLWRPKGMWGKYKL